MARTTNEFGGGEIVPAIEAITGIQAPVMEDFVAVPFGTVNHEHGERRQIQNLANNLKSSSGIERIPFNGIDELDTEQGSALPASGAVVFGGSGFVTTSTTSVVNITNSTGASGAITLTFTPGAATAAGFATAWATAWNANSNARLSEYTATANGAIVNIVADNTAATFNLSVFTVANTITAITSTETRANAIGDGGTIHALNTGDSRIRFVGSGWNIFSSGTIGTVLRTLTNNDYVEITFFGTALNLLVFIDNTPTYDWRATVDGGTEGGSLRPTNPSDVLKGNRKTNVILPITSGLTAEVHTVRIRNFNNGAGTDGFTLYGCEIINENAAITQQPGADFDGRVEALGGTTFPIEPDNTTIPSVNGRNLDGDAATYGTHADGARVLNYLTSGGQYKQSFNLADEAPVVQVAGEQEYTILINNGGSSSVTLPTGVTSFIATTFGSGGGGGGGGGAMGNQGGSGGGGGGAGKAGATFTRGASTQAETLALVIPSTANGGTGIQGLGGTTAGTGGTATIITGGTTISSAPGGGGGGNGPFFGTGGAAGTAGAIGTSQAFTGWTIASQTDTAGTAGGTGVPQGASGSTGATGGSVGGVGITPLIGSEGNGGGGGSGPGAGTNGGGGQTPGGGGGGGGGSDSPGSNTTGGTGAASRIYLIITATSGLTNTSFGVAAGEFTAGAASGADLGAATAVFGNAAFDSNRLNQEVIRRINFREFGANSEFALSGAATGRAFTIDDGTTTLVGNNTTNAAGDILSNNGDGQFFTLTFVGTGLDVLRKDAANGTGNDAQIAVTVDGLSIGNVPDGQTGSTQPRILPIVSGLSYGTHTVRISAAGSINVFSPGFQDFIIYGPKKPEIPTLDAGSLELSDYNIMADYSANDTAGLLTIGGGVVRKEQNREFLYTGGTGVTLAVSTAHIGGYNVDLTTIGQTAQYTFYGTGFDLRFILDGSTTVNGSVTLSLTTGSTTTSDFSGFTTSYYHQTANTATTFTPSTGVILNPLATPAIGTGSGSGVSVNGLNLGVHTLTVTKNTALSYHQGPMDVITPIHINDDTLKVGSEGLNNLTIDPVVEEDEQVALNLGEAKAWIKFNRANVVIDSSYNISAVIETGSGSFRDYSIFFDKPFKDEDYVWIGQKGGAGSTGNDVTGQVQRANVFRFELTSGSETYGANWFAAFYGELIDE